MQPIFPLSRITLLVGMILTAVLVISAMLTMAVPARADGAAQCTGAPTPPMQQALMAATNAERRRGGQAPMGIDPLLSGAAQRHACVLAQKGALSHRDGRGQRPMARMERAGYAACYASENLAMGSPDPKTTVAAWRASPGHARNQQSPYATAMGVGRARDGRGRIYWVALYAAPCQQADAGRDIWGKTWRKGG